MTSLSFWGGWFEKNVHTPENIIQPKLITLESLRKQLPSYFCVYFERSPPAGRTLGRGSWGSSLKFLCSHVPMEVFLFYETRKKEVNKKQSSLRKGRFLYLCVLLRFGNTLGIMPLSAPSPRRIQLYRNLPPYNFLSLGGLGCWYHGKNPKMGKKWIKSI